MGISKSPNTSVPGWLYLKRSLQILTRLHENSAKPMYNLQPLRDGVWLCRTSSLQKCSHLATRKSRSGKGPRIPKNAAGWNDSRFRKTISYSTSPTSIGKTRPYYLGVLFQIWHNDTVIPVVGWCLQKHFRIKIIFLTLCREVPIALSAVPIVGRQSSFKSFKIDVSCNGWCTTTIQTSSFERTQSKLFHFALSTTETLGSLWLRMSSNPFWNSAASGVTVMLRGCCLVNLLPTLAV